MGFYDLFLIESVELGVVLYYLWSIWDRFPDLPGTQGFDLSMLFLYCISGIDDQF